MLTGDFLKELERIVNQGRSFELDGQTYSALSMQPVFFEPRPSTLKVQSLTAIKSYLDSNRDKLDRGSLLLHVEDQSTVTLVSVIRGRDLKRDCYISAKHSEPQFGFGTWMTSEQFIIGVNALVIQTTERDRLLNYVSRIMIDSASIISDTGVSQTAQVRVGVRGNLTEGQVAPSRIALRPYRTFAEVEQPEGNFIFRIRRQDDAVQLSLHEADGGVWKADAMRCIAEWLSKNLPDVAVIT